MTAKPPLRPISWVTDAPARSRRRPASIKMQFENRRRRGAEATRALREWRGAPIVTMQPDHRVRVEENQRCRFDEKVGPSAFHVQVHSPRRRDARGPESSYSASYVHCYNPSANRAGRTIAHGND